MGLWDDIQQTYLLADVGLGGVLPGGIPYRVGAGPPLASVPGAGLIGDVLNLPLLGLALGIDVVGGPVAGAITGNTYSQADYWAGVDNVLHNQVTPQQYQDAAVQAVEEVGGGIVNRITETIKEILPDWLLPAAVGLGAVFLVGKKRR